MRFFITQEHLHYFLKEHFVEFENCVTPQQCELLHSQSEEALAQRLKKASLNKNTASNKELFLSGRNFWQEGVDIKKICAKQQIGDIAFALFKKKPLRLAFAQYLRTNEGQDSPFTENLSLQQISCFRPLLGGLIVFFSDPSNIACQEGATSLPKKAGNAFFVSAHLPLPLPLLFKQKNLSALLLGFGPEKTMYCLEKNDPFTHDLKKEGFVFGDRVKEEQCPTIFR